MAFFKGAGVGVGGDYLTRCFPKTTVEEVLLPAGDPVTLLCYKQGRMSDTRSSKPRWKQLEVRCPGML